MAWTLSEVQAMQAALKGTLLSLASKTASSMTTQQRQIQFVEMAKVKAQLDEFDTKEQQLLGIAGTGVALASFSDPQP